MTPPIEVKSHAMYGYVFMTIAATCYGISINVSHYVYQRSPFLSCFDVLFFRTTIFCSVVYCWA